MNRFTTACWVFGLGAWLACGVAARAQGTRPAGGEGVAPSKLEVLSKLPGQADIDQAVSPLLGEKWENGKAGLQFRAPKGLRQVTAGLPEAELVEFVSEPKDWVLKVAESKWPNPLPLTKYQDNMGTERPGILEMTLEQVKQTNPNAEVLRQDVVDLPEAKVGMLAIRYTVGPSRKLTQLAVLQTGNNTLYYIFNLTTPGAKAGQPEDQEDPGEREAVETLQALLDSVKFLDREQIRAEQDRRLFRTRLLYANWSLSKVRQALVDEQWVRLIKDGKDIGYTYIKEEKETRGGSEGVSIGVRSRTFPSAEVTVDTETWMYSNADRAHESWTTVARSADGKGNSNFMTELGGSDQVFERYTLTVKLLAKNSNPEPVERELPPFYLPQAMGHLLPRLLPLREAKPDQPVQLMFATYVPDQRQVMARYVDVLIEQDVVFNGKRVRAVPVLDRLGWEGTVTTHYVSPDGKYLGSETSVKEAGGEGKEPKVVRITLLPTDAATLNKLWDKPNLTAPERRDDEPQPRMRAGGTGATTQPAARTPAVRTDPLPRRVTNPDWQERIRARERERQEKLRQERESGR